MVKSFVKQHLSYLLLAVIILSLSAYMVYWGTQKEGFHIDEMFTVMEIRGDNMKRPYEEDGFFNTWHAASELESTVGVAENKTFSEFHLQAGIYRNLLHIAYSLQPGKFSVWPSLVLNILFFAGSLVVIYLFSGLLIDNKYLALLPVLGWGVSSAAVNLTLFIRFYAFKTLLCLLLAYFVLIAVKSHFKKPVYPVFITLIALIGSFTHQYFLVFMFFLSVFVCIYLLCKKEIKSFLIYSGAIALSLFLNLIIAEEGSVLHMIFAVFSGTQADSGDIGEVFIHGGADRTGEVIESITDNDGFLLKVKLYAEIISRALFAGIHSIAVILLFAALASIIFIKYRLDGCSIICVLNKQKVQVWLMTAGVCVLYLLLIALIAPYQEIRYVFCITPLISILFFSLLIQAFKAIGFTGNIPVFASLAVICLLLPFGSIRSFNLHWGAEKTGSLLKDYHHLPVVCLGREKWEVASCYPQLFEFDNFVLFATTDDIDTEAIGELSFDDGLLLLMWYELDVSDADVLADSAGLDSFTHVADLVRHRVYYLK